MRSRAPLVAAAGTPTAENSASSKIGEYLYSLLPGIAIADGLRGGRALPAMTATGTHSGCFSAVGISLIGDGEETHHPQTLIDAAVGWFQSENGYTEFGVYHWRLRPMRTVLGLCPTLS